MIDIPKPSPEVRAILKAYCEAQRDKYGPDWKAIKAKEMSEGPIGQTSARLFEVLQGLRKP